MLLHEQMFFQY